MTGKPLRSVPLLCPRIALVWKKSTCTLVAIRWLHCVVLGAVHIGEEAAMLCVSHGVRLFSASQRTHAAHRPSPSPQFCVQNALNAFVVFLGVSESAVVADEVHEHRRMLVDRRLEVAVRTKNSTVYSAARRREGCRGRQHALVSPPLLHDLQLTQTRCHNHRCIELRRRDENTP